MLNYMTANQEPETGVAKISVSMPPDLLRKIDLRAAEDHRSRSQWIALQIERLMEEAEKELGSKQP